MEFQAGDRIRILGTCCEKELKGEEGLVLDPPYSKPHGYLRVLLDNHAATHPILHGMVCVHPEGVERIAV